jgi:hypothetical protein
MKKLVLLSILAMAFTAPVHAHGNHGNGGHGGEGGDGYGGNQDQVQLQGQLQGQASYQRGSDVTVEDHSTYEATNGRDYAPSIAAPALTTGTCMGSVSAGLTVPAVGIMGGSTVTDEECQIRYNSIRLAELQQLNAATLIMCQVETAKVALTQSGYKCPGKAADDDPYKAAYWSDYGSKSGYNAK